MKKTNLIIIVFFVIVLSFTSCNEDNLLTEIPKDFYSPENSYITTTQFQMAVNNLYYDLRYTYWGANNDMMFTRYYATDFAYNATNYKPGQIGKLNDYANVLVPNERNLVLGWWTNYYNMIKDANVIIDRLDNPKCVVTDAEKKIFRSEAMFFRAFAYRVLAQLYGGVPLILNESASPQTDLTRSTREAVYNQCAADLEYAVANLSDIDNVKDGKVSKQVCQHLLSEIYICLKNYDKAITMASAVIDYPSCKLMTSRFGSRMNEPGDVYWDLFRLNNQNRTSGNTEGLLVLQYDYQNAGSNNSWNMNIFVLPFYSTLTLDGVSLFQGITDKKGGFGVGWIRPTNFFLYSLWGADANKDIRNSAYNIIRDVQIDNPESPYFGKWMVQDGINKMAGLDTVRNWYPFITKVYRMTVPDDIIKKNADGTPQKTAFGETLLVSSQLPNYKDEYVFRLAETYLLRAEAYIEKGDLPKAADDINTIRLRANATPILPSDATIDFVLDERLRELYMEEWRQLTLLRLDKFVERNRKYNPYTGKVILDYHNLYPIPYSEIERNINATLTQNPGYSN